MEVDGHLSIETLVVNLYFELPVYARVVTANHFEIKTFILCNYERSNLICDLYDLIFRSSPMDVIYCGWLTKSPPENKMKGIGPFKSVSNILATVRKKEVNAFALNLRSRFRLKPLDVVLF